MRDSKSAGLEGKYHLGFHDRKNDFDTGILYLGSHYIADNVVEFDEKTLKGYRLTENDELVEFTLHEIDGRGGWVQMITDKDGEKETRIIARGETVFNFRVAVSNCPSSSVSVY